MVLEDSAKTFNSVQEYYNKRIKEHHTNTYNKAAITDIVAFTQVWGSTCLGFGGCGGSMLTSALTICVFFIDDYVDVFFGGKIAYRKKKSKILIEDINRRNMADVAHSSKYDKE